MRAIALFPLVLGCAQPLDCGDGTHEEDGTCVADETTGGSTLPSWLREAAALKTTLLLNGNPVVRAEPLDDAQITTVQGQLDNILISRSRYAPGAAKPIQASPTLV